MAAKETKGRKLTKKAVMKGGQPIKTSLPMHLEKLAKLSKGKLNVTLANLKSVMNIRHARELKRANTTGRDLLSDAVKCDISQVLFQKKQEGDCHG